ncbi:MAG: hypothetical protein KTR19_01595 [Hyphomicrobiales bacterium]|nr:hypothetical protein [Hyphomicrobiales bacterium]
MLHFSRFTLGASSDSSGRAIPALLSLAVMAFGAMICVTPAQAKYQQLPEGRISIDIGEAFVPSEDFSGYVDKKTGASIAVIELPASAYDKLKAIPDSEEALENEGFGGMKKAELKDREGVFIYLVGDQDTPAGEVTKFVLMFGESDLSGLIVANVPKTAMKDGQYSRKGVEAILAKAIVREPPDPNAIFRFDYLGPFVEAFDHGGMTKAYNVSGNKPNPGENRLVEETVLMVSSSIHGDEIDVVEQAKKSFMELGGMKDQQIVEEKSVEISDLKGHQIIGEVTDEDSGKKISINLVLISGKPFGSFMLLGSVPVDDKGSMMPEVEKVIASFELIK